MAEYIKVPAGVYDMVTRCMEQEFPDHVAIRYVAEDGKTVVEKKYREYAQDIRQMCRRDSSCRGRSAHPARRGRLSSSCRAPRPCPDTPAPPYRAGP